MGTQTASGSLSTSQHSTNQSQAFQSSPRKCKDLEHTNRGEAEDQRGTGAFHGLILLTPALTFHMGGRLPLTKQRCLSLHLRSLVIPLPKAHSAKGAQARK